MARLFASTSSMYGSNGAAAATTYPITMACGFNPSALTANMVLMSLNVSAGSASRLALECDGSAAGDPVRATSVNTSNTAAFASSSAGYNGSAALQYCAATFTSDSARAAFYAGGNKGTSTTSNTPGTLNRTLVGCRLSSGTPGIFADGSIAVPCIWNVILNDDEIAMLAAGYHPSQIRPESIVFCPDMDQGFSPEPDHWGGYDLTLTNSPTQVADPPLIYPQGIVQAVYAPAGAPPGGLSIPIAAYHYMHRVRRSA